MSLLKNSFGVSVKFSERIAAKNFDNKFSGSSFDRKSKKRNKTVDDDAIEACLKKPLKLPDKNNGYKPRTLSKRSGTKVRKKVIAFSRIQHCLTFLTLTFLNKVDDRMAIKVLGAFLDYVSKQNKDFEYLWVVEKQTKNLVFKNNPHFHLITNIRWDINRWMEYWMDVQKKNGIKPRDVNFRPSSSFDVRYIKSSDVKSVGNYITKYITKNKTEFHGALWNCSKRISRLYTDFYSDVTFMNQFYQLQEKGLLKGKIIAYVQDYCTVYLIPLNNITRNFYNRIDEKNKIVWQMDNPKNLELWKEVNLN